MGINPSEVFPITPRLRLLVSDIDGTLVTADKVLTPAAIKAVASLAKANVDFTVVSSRPPRGMAEIISKLKVCHPFAAFNGGSLVALDMSLIQAHRLSGEVATRTLKLIASGGVDAWVFAGGAWFLRDAQGSNVERERLTVGFDPTLVDSFETVIGRIDKIVGVSDDHARLSVAEAEVRRLLGAEANVERSQPYYLDITHPKANKGEAVRALARMIGVDLRQTAVIGDMGNDVAMFRVAGFAVVMGQSPSGVKAEADAVTGSNEADGFAEAVDRLVLPRAPRAAS